MFLSLMCHSLAGVLDGGFGLSHFNAVLSALNVPPVTDKLFKRNERFMGPSIEKIAQDSCRSSIRLEKEITIASNSTEYKYAMASSP